MLIWVNWEHCNTRCVQCWCLLAVGLGITNDGRILLHPGVIPFFYIEEVTATFCQTKCMSRQYSASDSGPHIMPSKIYCYYHCIFSRDGWLRTCCTQYTLMCSAKSEEHDCSLLPCPRDLEGRAKVNWCTPFTLIALTERDAIFLFSPWSSGFLNLFALSGAVLQFGK